MSEEIILDDFEPTPEVLKYWAYDLNVYLMQQDEEDIICGMLGDTAVDQMLIECACDPTCPKRDDITAILSGYCQRVVLSRNMESAKRIAEWIAEAQQKHPLGVDSLWSDQFNRLFDRLQNPRPLSADDALQLADDLLAGEFTRRNTESTHRSSNGLSEFLISAGQGMYRIYIYIDQKSGVWDFTDGNMRDHDS